MKKSLISIIALLSLSSAFAANIQVADLVGKYAITNQFQPGVVNEVIIEANGQVTLVERSQGFDFVCKGEATLEDDIIESEMSCPGGLSFEQRIDLTNVAVEDLSDSFTAPVYSSLFGMEIPMLFERLEK